MAQSIRALTGHGSKFVQALEVLDAFVEQKLNDIDMKITSKAKEYEDLKRKAETEYKNACIETKQQLDEYRLGACEEIAESFGRVLIDKEELAALKVNVADAQKTLDAQLAQLGAEHKRSHEASVRAIETMAALKEKATHASLVAKTEQQAIEIQVLHAQIKSQSARTGRAAGADSQGRRRQRARGRAADVREDLVK